MTRQVEQEAVRGQHNAVGRVGQRLGDLPGRLDAAEDDEGRVALDRLPEKLGGLCLTLRADDGALLVLLRLLHLWFGVVKECVDTLLSDLTFEELSHRHDLSGSATAPE